MPPNRDSVSRTAERMLTGSVTSRRRASIRSLRAQSPAFSGVRIVATTFQPWAWKWRAVASPMPLDEPVMRTVLVMVFALRSRFRSRAAIQVAVCLRRFLRVELDRVDGRVRLAAHQLADVAVQVT